MRIGQGYDAHRLSSGHKRKLILGGVEIPFNRGLEGHSDADVLTHAIIDAVLGAAGMADIGAMFPDTHSEYKDVSSLLLLENAADAVKSKGFTVINIDSTIVAQSPKLSPFRSEMRENISNALGIEISRVNVKFTTEELMGFTGRGEGISAMAVCSLY